MTEAHDMATSEWRRHGTLLLPCVGGIALVAVHGYSLGVMMGPLQQEFGWSRAEISAGNLVIACVSLLVAPLVGLLIDRVGPRVVALAGVAAYAVLLTGLATTTGDIGSWWVRWAVLGLASSMILPTVWTAAINRVFIVNRGKALAFALLGTGLAATFVPALANALIEKLGWRGAYVALAAGAGGLVLALVLLFFRLGGARMRAGRAAPAAAASGMTAREGFRSPAFFKLALGVFVFGVTSLALAINAVPVLQARGLERPAAAGVAGLIGIGSILGRLGGGFLLDRFDAKRVAAAAVAAPILAMALLLAAPGSILAAATAMLLLGLSLGAEVDACSYLAARHFGMRSFGALFGTINGVVVFGTGIAPVVANHVYDVAHSYDPVLWATAPLCAGAAALFLALGGYPEFAEEGAPAAVDAPAAATRLGMLGGR